MTACNDDDLIPTAMCHPCAQRAYADDVPALLSTIDQLRAEPAAHTYTVAPPLDPTAPIRVGLAAEPAAKKGAQE